MKKRAQSPLRILVVEDNNDIRRVMRELLNADGHDVYIAADGETGVAYLQSQDFDLIITDLGLPGMSGWDLARASKRYQTDTPVVAISSWQGRNAETKLADFGIDVVIWKPFRFDEIIQAVRSLCCRQTSPRSSK
jgi:DNA-binding response OmpR family regulator